MPQAHRDKIKLGNILNALQEHVMGERDMSATQVSAGVALLRKVMPDLAQTTLEGGEKPITQRTIVTGVPRAADIHADITPAASDDPPGVAARH